MFRILTLVSLFALCAPAFAQSNAPAMDRLAPYNGSYTLDGTPAMADGSFDGTLTVSPILGGHFQQWDWEMTMRGEDFDEKTYLRFIVAFDRVANAYTIFRFDSRDADSPTRESGVADPSQGRLSFDGDALVMSWTATNPDDPNRAGTFRNTVRLRPNGLHVVTDVQPDDGSPLVAIATTRAARR